MADWTRIQDNQSGFLDLVWQCSLWEGWSPLESFLNPSTERKLEDPELHRRDHLAGRPPLRINPVNQLQESRFVPPWVQCRRHFSIGRRELHSPRNKRASWAHSRRPC